MQTTTTIDCTTTNFCTQDTDNTEDIDLSPEGEESHMNTNNSRGEVYYAVPQERSPSTAPPVALLLSTLVSYTANMHSSRLNHRRHETCFEGRCLPPISLEDYLSRIETHANCSKETFITALVYVDRVIQLNPGFRVTSANVHRLILACILIALKVQEDLFYTNKFYSAIGGVPLPELNMLERRLLNLLNFELFVSVTQFGMYQEALNSAIHVVQRIADEQQLDGPHLAENDVDDGDQTGETPQAAAEFDENEARDSHNVPGE
ncbi:cyclin, N-terminal domain protein [Pelomyxa schiedti]|nr:cyclin, N-terminal domain protein [Pelomyxa schiedti]